MADKNSRSLGFLPLVIMTIIYLICIKFTDEIGPLTSAPGMFPFCPMPRASP